MNAGLQSLPVDHCQRCGETGGQLIQLFQNLIANAIRYRGELPPHIEVNGTEGESDWTVSVRDNGIGFESSQAERIFQLFQRLNPADVSGMGIGLSVCRRIAERHGGKMWAESTVGKGAVFYFTLPKRQRIAENMKNNGRGVVPGRNGA